MSEVTISTVIETNLEVTFKAPDGEIIETICEISLIKPNNSKYFWLDVETLAENDEGEWETVQVDTYENTEYLKDQYHKGLCWEESPEEVPLTGEDFHPEVMPTFLKLMGEGKKLGWY